jgi:hypothetical protein
MFTFDPNASLPHQNIGNGRRWLKVTASWRKLMMPTTSQDRGMAEYSLLLYQDASHRCEVAHILPTVLQGVIE